MTTDKMERLAAEGVIEGFTSFKVTLVLENGVGSLQTTTLYHFRLSFIKNGYYASANAPCERVVLPSSSRAPSPLGSASFRVSVLQSQHMEANLDKQTA